MKKFFYAFSIIFVLLFLGIAVISLASNTVGSIDPTSAGYNKAYLLNDGGIGGSTLLNTGKFTTQSAKNVVVTDTELTGYIWGAQTGWISLNCSNTSSCGSSNYKVSNNSEGTLTGYGWGPQAGWVRFNPTGAGSNTVKINSSGDFTGYAWSQAFGYISFNCSNDSSCGTINFKTNTDWRPLSTRGSSSSSSSSSGGSSGGSGSGSSTSSSSSSTSSSSTSSSSTSSSSTSSSSSGEASSSTSSTSSGEASSSTSSGEASSSTSTSSGEASGSTSSGEASSSTSSGDGSNSSSGEASSSGDGSGSSSGSFGDFLDSLFGGGSSSGGSGGSSSGPSIFVDVITQSVSNVFSPAVTAQVSKTLNTAKKIVEKTTVQEVTKVATTTGVVSGTVVTVGASLFLNPIALSEIVFVPIRLWSLFLVAIGIRKRRKPWGTVYDSVTKQPIDPAYVVLLDMMGNEIATSITDLDGRYGFLAPAGVYKIVASKTNYKFPSDKLKDQTEDELYIDIYKGDNVTITKDGDVITKNIPLDPEKFDWNEFAKNQQSLMKFSRRRDFILDKIGTIAFNIGFAVSTVTTILSPSTYGEVIIGIYVVLGIVRHIAPHAQARGAMVMADGTPLSYGVLRIFTDGTNTEVTHKVADAKGNFYALVQNGKYYVTIDQKNRDQSYTKVFTSEPFEVTKGILKKKFIIPNTPQAPTTPAPPVPTSPSDFVSTPLHTQNNGEGLTPPIPSTPTSSASQEGNLSQTQSNLPTQNQNTVPHP